MSGENQPLNRKMQNTSAPQGNPVYRDDEGRKSSDIMAHINDDEKAFDVAFRALVKIVMGEEGTDGAGMEQKIKKEETRDAIKDVVNSYKKFEVNWSKGKWKTRMVAEGLMREKERRQAKAVDVISGHKELEDAMKR